MGNHQDKGFFSPKNQPFHRKFSHFRPSKTHQRLLICIGISLHVLRKGLFNSPRQKSDPQLPTFWTPRKIVVEANLLLTKRRKDPRTGGGDIEDYVGQ